MRLRYNTSLLVLIIACLHKAMLEDQDEKVYAAVILVTPGATSPTYPIPTMNWTDWPERSPHRLTAYGMRQEYLLGQELRTRYKAVAKSKTLSARVHVQVINRTDAINSVQAFLQGFVSSNTQKLSDRELQLSLPPISVHTHILAAIKKNVLPFGLFTFPFDSFNFMTQNIFDPRSCPQAEIAAKSAFNHSHSARSLAKSYEPIFYPVIKEAYKLRKADWPYPTYIPLLDSIVSVSRQWQSTWLNESIIEQLQQFSDKMATHVSYASKEANKLLASPVIIHVERYFNRTIKALLTKSSTQQNDILEIVLTAEILVGSVLKHLGVEFVGHVPEASSVRFELHGPTELKNATQEDFNVRAYFNDRAILFDSDYCSYPACNYAEFADLALDITYPNYQERCHRQGDDEDEQY